MSWTESIKQVKTISACIKITADVENMLNDEEFFGDTVDTSKEGVDQHMKRVCLKGTISKGKAYLLGGEWIQEKVDKAIGKTININIC